MKKTSKVKKIFYGLCGLAFLLFLGWWIFFTFYFENTLNRYTNSRLTEAVSASTHGKYNLTMGKITYNSGTFACRNFILTRIGYDSSEHGNVLAKISIDTVTFIGVQWWDMILGREMRMSGVVMNSPEIHMINIEKDHSSLKYLQIDTSEKPTTVKRTPVIRFDSIVLRNIAIYLPGEHDGSKPEFSDIKLKLRDFSLDPETFELHPLLFSKHIDFSMLKTSYLLSGGDYSLVFHHLRGSFSDSLLMIDTFEYKPMYSKDEFATKHKFVQPRLDFRCFNLQFHGINFEDLIHGIGISFKKCDASSWFVDFYCDKRKPMNPHPPAALMPNDLVRAITIPIDVDSLILDHGTVHWAERQPGSVEPGTLSFSNARVSATPFCTDTLIHNMCKPTSISFSAIFIGESQVNGSLIYPLHDRSLNCSIEANVGGFSANRLNPELIPIERIEVKDGRCDHGVIRMNIRDGISTTTVTPVYHDLSIKVLPKSASSSDGLIEGIKTLLANTFSLRSNNKGGAGKTPVSATTTLKRTKDEEFLQFAWYSLRQSLGKVVGFSPPSQ